jgi:hypothetical protein
MRGFRCYGLLSLIFMFEVFQPDFLPTFTSSKAE